MVAAITRSVNIMSVRVCVYMYIKKRRYLSFFFQPHFLPISFFSLHPPAPIMPLPLLSNSIACYTCGAEMMPIYIFYLAALSFVVVDDSLVIVTHSANTLRGVHVINSLVRTRIY